MSSSKEGGIAWVSNMGTPGSWHRKSHHLASCTFFTPRTSIVTTSHSMDAGQFPHATTWEASEAKGGGAEALEASDLGYEEDSEVQGIKGTARLFWAASQPQAVTLCTVVHRLAHSLR